MNPFSKTFKLGILGGGQLGRMLIQASIDLNTYIKIMDPDAEAPCKYLAHDFVQGSLMDFDAVYAFGKNVDVLTIEIEHVNVDALEKLEVEGVKVYPQPNVIRIIQDKRVQKQFYKDHGIPTPDFVLTDTVEDVAKHVDFLPAFQKLGKAGYDGRGVQRLKSAEDLGKAFTEPGLLEKAIDFEKEISVIVARRSNGEMETFPVVELVFHPEYNLVEYLFAPAQISPEIEAQSQQIARKVAEKLGIVGLLAVEMFLTKEGEVLVNESAPRPHNSGHHTIKANYTSQFEQHLRAVLDLPLGSTHIKSLAAMVNLLGEAGYTGDAYYEGMETVLQIAGVYPHLYGKQTTKPFRKMGHVTILDTNLSSLQNKVSVVRDSLKVISK
ncbi:5-(carboxyamino)imidazole ribonucleotide synthase [Cytophagaceae bacterium DM2B3-1]|uniref:N5-carboxyaminoimidazole ribonucleotide synthase n=1 Tax=Xanthocytophaga flava TaxID=3048013 RepID=A0ABT7CG54_9BACT|nr:5-(carboxyamino)imidazole ribonucleotide synthase [Xanthocytophaga flavus]MDJ1492720.1 5-(carboxyamino)imidazole ribonucleotide synthase [Xanthocytophaga flavus]